MSVLKHFRLTVCVTYIFAHFFARERTDALEDVWEENLLALTSIKMLKPGLLLNLVSS